MSAPKTLAELREAVRHKAAVEMSQAAGETLMAAIRRDIDAQYAAWTETAAQHFYAEPPEGWGPAFKLTRRQRVNIWVWRIRGWLAWPFVQVVRLLDPYALRQDD